MAQTTLNCKLNDQLSLVCKDDNTGGKSTQPIRAKKEATRESAERSA
jgi:hypothetical protein